MARKHYTPEQIIRMLREAEVLIIGIEIIQKIFFIFHIHNFCLINKGISFKNNLIPMGEKDKYVSNILSKFRNGLS